MLTVRVDRLRQWCRPGLLSSATRPTPCLRWACRNHLAIQDAVAAANEVAWPLREGRLTRALAAGSAAAGIPPTRATQCASAHDAGRWSAPSSRPENSFVLLLRSGCWPVFRCSSGFPRGHWAGPAAGGCPDSGYWAIDLAESALSRAACVVTRSLRLSRAPSGAALGQVGDHEKQGGTMNPRGGWVAVVLAAMGWRCRCIRPGHGAGDQLVVVEFGTSLGALGMNSVRSRSAASERT